MISASFVQIAAGRAVKYIKTVSRGEASGLVASVYLEAEREFALVPPLTLHAPAPEILAGVWSLTRETFIVDRAGRLDREVVAAAVSQANSCPFCVEVHGAMLHAGSRHRLAGALKGETSRRGGSDLLTAWALATRAPGTAILANPPFSPQEAPQIIGTAVLFHFINRMVNVFLEPSPTPFRSPLLKAALGRLFGRLAGRRLLRVDAVPGRSLDLLPDAPLPAEFAWARANEHVAGALARWTASIELWGGRALSDPVRGLITNEMEKWVGEDRGLGNAWIEAAIAPLKSESDRAAARLGLLTALASYRVGENHIAQYRRWEASPARLVGLTAWASLAAVRRLSSWIHQPFRQALEDVREPHGSIQKMAG